ncbi:MAG: SEC-C domain-containing protein [Elusimicrobia bacterium]|nr:SEC-C domain-containing protein [Candidatus Obscuribacterium magneticum]
MNHPIGRNDPCHCGSGKKYKKCHLEADELKERKAREKMLEEAAKKAAAEAEAAKGEAKTTAAPVPRRQEETRKHGWFSKVTDRMGFWGKQQRRTPPSSKSG